jgi:hypothetical protein
MSRCGKCASADIKYICRHQSCPPEKKWQAYCVTCAELGEHRHPHIRIVNFVRDYSWDRWTALDT